MKNSYLFESHQHWVIRLILFFCQERVECRKGRVYVYKALARQRYLLRSYRPTRPIRRRFVLFRAGGK